MLIIERVPPCYSEDLQIIFPPSSLARSGDLFKSACLLHGIRVTKTVPVHPLMRHTGPVGYVVLLNMELVIQLLFVFCLTAVSVYH